VKSLLQRFKQDRAKYPSGPALFHSRFGTSGSEGKFNCHPFRMGDKKTVVAHNGVLPAEMQPSKPNDRRCDTHMAAEELFATKWGHLSSKKARNRLGEAIGKNNKLVILSIDPSYPSWSYIINEKSGTWDNGIWYSNYDYLGWIKEEPKYPMTDCSVCYSKKSVDPDWKICDMCWTCLSCMKDTEECLCHFYSYKETTKVSLSVQKDDEEEEAYSNWWRQKEQEEQQEYWWNTEDDIKEKA